LRQELAQTESGVYTVVNSPRKALGAGVDSRGMGVIAARAVLCALVSRRRVAGCVGDGAALGDASVLG
jgi:hypothetical protein